jgi:hypothetical protein
MFHGKRPYLSKYLKRYLGKSIQGAGAARQVSSGRNVPEENKEPKN